MSLKTKPYDNNELLATIVKMTQGTVVQKLGMQGKDFYKDPKLYGNQTLLEEARGEVMYNILEEISERIQRPLIDYSNNQKTILLDDKTIKEIGKSIDKAIVQMAKEINKQVESIHTQEVKNASKNGKKSPQMNELRYSEYLIQAGQNTQATKFISNMQKGTLEKETKWTFKGLVDSFKAAIRRVLTMDPVLKIESAAQKAITADKEKGKFAAKEVQKASETTPLMSRK
jgi:hypothetical protein